MLEVGRSLRGVATIAALNVGLASGMKAQQRELFHWSGRVDQEIQLTISGRNLTASNIGPSEPGQRRANVIAALPRADGQISVQVVDGRGTVDVFKQPTVENGYTAVIRIRDPQGGAGDYTFNAYWQPVAAGVLGPPFTRRREPRVALQWSGDVDGNLLITIRPGGVAYRTVAGAEPRGVESSLKGLPADATSVDVTTREGRGEVTVVQQPTAANGYTAIVRVRDPQPGFGHYNFDVMWQ